MNEVSLCFDWVIFLLKMNVPSLQERLQSATFHLNQGFSCVHYSRVSSVSPKKTPKSCIVLNQLPLCLQLRSKQNHKKEDVFHADGPWVLKQVVQQTKEANIYHSHLRGSSSSLPQILLLWDKQESSAYKGPHHQSHFYQNMSI